MWDQDLLSPALSAAGGMVSRPKEAQWQCERTCMRTHTHTDIFVKQFRMENKLSP